MLILGKLTLPKPQLLAPWSNGYSMSGCKRFARDNLVVILNKSTLPWSLITFLTNVMTHAREMPAQKPSNSPCFLIELRGKQREKARKCPRENMDKFRGIAANFRDILEIIAFILFTMILCLRLFLPFFKDTRLQYCQKNVFTETFIKTSKYLECLSS